MNFIYFNPDEMRADVLGCYGHPLVKTPNIDKFAADAVLFEQCHVQHTVCTPSRISFMTGWYPHVSGHRTLWHTIRPHEPNTLRYLKESGYDIHVIGKNDLLSPESTLLSVTQVHKTRKGAGSESAYPDDDPRHMNFLFKPLEAGPDDYYRIVEAIRFLESRDPGDKPFMLYLPLILPHCPYTCPEPWYSMYDPDSLPPLRKTESVGKPDYFKAIRRFRNLDANSERDMRKIMAVYLGMVSYVDHLFGMLMDKLIRTGLMEDTVVFFFSDHGDWAGDYGLVEKWPSGLDDCLTRIPMIIRNPGCKEGHVVKEQVECFDIMPTTLELAGVRPSHTHFASSLLPQLAGGAGDPDRLVFAEGGYDRHEPHCFEGKADDAIAGNPKGIYFPKGKQQQEEPQTVSRSTMVRSLTHKLIRRPGTTHELYDLVHDPLEERNVYGEAEYTDIQKELELRMLDWYIHTADIVPDRPDPRDWTTYP